MGHRQWNLRQGIDFLEAFGEVREVSSIYETSPVDMVPRSDYFYNLALVFQSELEPRPLLGGIKQIEAKMGRDLSRRNSSGQLGRHYSPRPIDIDILLAEGIRVEEPDLVIPHREMSKRGFVLVPLAEIAPGVVHPVLNKPIAQLLHDLDTDEKIIKLSPDSL